MDPHNRLNPEVSVRLKDLAVKLMGEEGRLDEGVDLHILLDVIEEMQEALQKGPVCPVCKTRMYRAAYKGYYDSFHYWDCGCGEGQIPVEHTCKGSYA